MIIIRARAKKPEDIDPRFVCCDDFRKRANELAGRALELDPEIFWGSWTCSFCGSPHGDIPFRRIHGQRGDFSAVPMPYVDLDEGK